MKIPNSEILTFSQFEQLLGLAEARGWQKSYNSEKHQLILEGEDSWEAKVFLPWDQKWDGVRLKRYDDFRAALVAIRAGQAVTGLFHHGELIDHKVFRAYMVRQKQGKSQIKYLKTKGKSRAGSRIRLGETNRFFEEINERLNSYQAEFAIDRWGISCAKTLWPYFFNSDVAPPFDSKDSNFHQIPIHFQQASFEELQEAGKILSAFHLLKNPNSSISWELNSDDEEMNSDENW